MATRKEAMAFIRFQLEQLRAKNSFHEFEHICRQYARCRIDPSVIPATGPVTGTGDQGRDFESLVVFDGNASSGSSGHRNVFACTLQQKGLRGKLKGDMRKLVVGRPVRTVYFFCCADVVVAERHALQKWAYDRLSVELEVIDGQALSEHLADKDLLWIAVEYLDIGPQHLPDFSRTGSLYEQYLHEWREPGRDIASVAGYLTVRHGVRQTTREVTEESRDAHVWLDAMGRFIEHIDSMNPLWLAAVYELVIGTFFLRRDVSGLEELIVGYVETLPEHASDCSPDQLRDYLTMLNCAQGARSHGTFDVEEQWLDHYRQRIGCSSAEIQCGVAKRG